MMANRLDKRIEKLEDAIRPEPKRDWEKIIQRVGETREEAIARTGFTPEDFEKNNVFVVQFVSVESIRGKKYEKSK